MNPELLTFGCRLNAAESDTIRAHAAGQGDLVVVNTCAVTAEAERQARQAIRRAHRARPEARIVVTGCAAQISPSDWSGLPGVSRVLGNAEKLRPESWAADAPGAVGDIAAARIEARPVAAPAAPALRARALLEVQQGCDHRCTFCIIPFGRGPSRSVPPEAAAARLAALVAAGYREVVLTGVDLTSYGADLPGRPRLGALVRQLLDAAPGLARLRLSSLDPSEIDDTLWGLLGDEPRLMPHLHLSLQAGSDLILKRMKRRHSRDGALAAIARARRLRPGLAIGGDLIAGFPTETDTLFGETLDFVRAADIPFLHVFPYSERPGTPASRMPAVPVAERRARAAALREAASANAARFHAAQLGATVELLAESETEARSPHFCRVAVAGASPGALFRARVTGASAAGLVAEAA